MVGTEPARWLIHPVFLHILGVGFLDMSRTPPIEFQHKENIPNLHTRSFLFVFPPRPQSFGGDRVGFTRAPRFLATRGGSGRIGTRRRGKPASGGWPAVQPGIRLLRAKHATRQHAVGGHTCRLDRLLVLCRFAGSRIDKFLRFLLGNPLLVETWGLVRHGRRRR